MVNIQHHEIENYKTIDDWISKRIFGLNYSLSLEKWRKKKAHFLAMMAKVFTNLYYIIKARTLKDL